MAYLLIGGTGKTGSRVASLLKSANKSVLLASRRGPDGPTNGHPAIKFDWTNESTWSKAFEQGPIAGVYLMEPQVDKPWVPMIKFVDVAKQNGVKRFVLCAGTTAAVGKDGMGRVWEHFINTGVEYSVLRPSWFMENLVEPGLVYTITQLNTIFTATGDGKIPFISADDIADMAYHGLTDANPGNCDYRVLGPELLTYDDIAATLSTVLGRKIQHVKLDDKSRIAGLVQAGVSEYLAQFLTRIEVLAAEGYEEAMGDAVEKVTGHKPKTFKKFAEDNKAVWGA